MDKVDNLAGSPPGAAPIPPLKNPKYRHIARSAAKRESVQMLGSIKDLQLHFSRAGLEHRDGVGAGVRGFGPVEEGDEENHPPGEMRKTVPPRPWKEVETPRIDPKEAMREARSQVGNVRSLWGLGMPSSPSMAFSLSPLSPVSPANPKHQQDTRTTLVSTVEAIRRVRQLALSVSHPSIGGRRHSGPAALLPPKSKPRASLSTPSRPNAPPRAVSSGVTERKSSVGPDQRPDELAQLRKVAIEILHGLRHLEERLRIEPVSGPVDIPNAGQSPRRAMSPGAADESSGSSVPDTNGTASSFTEPESYDLEEEEYNLNDFAQDEKEHALTWEERLVQENRMYKSWEEEEARVGTVRDSIRRWVGVVEGLFGVRDRGGVEELETWVKEDMWKGWSMERAHAFLLANLPLNLQLVIPNTRTPEFRQAFLARLSDGYLLAQALNIVLLTSSKPWGFISEEDIHDTLKSDSTLSGSTIPDVVEDKKEKSWTFMRIGNLTCWAAALKHRYNLPIHMPASSSTYLTVPPSLPQPRSAESPSPTLSPSMFGSPLPPEPRFGPAKRKDSRIKENAARVDFDPVTVAKRGEGWEEMLGGLLRVWVEEAAREVKEDVGLDLFEEEGDD
ncbi:hypothetical protein BD324DRAFT_618983 [Kockovaella imperatae]|uniref:Uncharacterized protein n=1 Tax=Kockovaella imperatae TaxID=4999 RepID=A0A1Y1UP46_9TREE|nr:hypothetical protein BD324DRAFT_618983 [Kockovaella imperatae]ORX39246.1 hypothetical protein BD324DRAFT_618983 [Kockovaella imperatae]